MLATNRLKKKNPVSAVCGADEKVQYMQKKWYILTKQNYIQKYNLPLQMGFFSWPKIKQILRELFGMIKKPQLFWGSKADLNQVI